jgi:acyl-CoA thioester hydrolase
MTMLREHQIEIRVRYQETDAQGRVHHANYLTYFEMGRIELLRAGGVCYKEFERSGAKLVVAEVSCRYMLPAEYDDVLRLRTVTERTKGARITMRHELYRADEQLAVGRTVVACVNAQENVCLLPDDLLLE